MDVNYFSKMKKEYLRSRSRVFLSFLVIRVLMLILPDVSTSSVIQMLTRKFFFFISCDNWKRYQNRRRKKKRKMRTRNYKSKEKYV